MARLKTLNHVPPKGWMIEEPDGFELKGASEGQLVKILVRHRAAKGTPITEEDARAEIHTQICERWPQGCTKGGADAMIATMSWKGMASRFVTAVNRFVMGGLKPVDQATASARASVCLSCTFNRPSNVAKNAGCATCKRSVFNDLTDAIAKGAKNLLLSGAKTDYDDRLRACGMCGCDLKMMVHFPLEALGVNADERKLINVQAPWCWKVA